MLTPSSKDEQELIEDAKRAQELPFNQELFIKLGLSECPDRVKIDPRAQTSIDAAQKKASKPETNRRHLKKK